MDEKKQLIRDFICKVTRRKQIEDTENIFCDGIVNSLFAMQLVLFLEKNFNVQISGQDLKQENFSTVQSICNFIESKKSL